MSLKNVDIEAVLRRQADKRIEDAMAEGKFDNLAGKGQPLDLEPMPAEESARMTWWMLRILKNNDYTPDEVRWRKLVETMKVELRSLRDERKLAPLVAKINALVHKLNTLGTNAISLSVSPVDLETERQLLRDRLAGGTRED